MHALSNWVRTIDMHCDRALGLDTTAKCQLALGEEGSNPEALIDLHKRVNDVKDEGFNRMTSDGCHTTPIWYLSNAHLTQA